MYYTTQKKYIALLELLSTEVELPKALILEDL